MISGPDEIWSYETTISKKYHCLAASAFLCLENSSYALILATDVTLLVDMKPTTKQPFCNKYASGKRDQFSTDHRPRQRPLSEASNKIINNWWLRSKITMGPKADIIKKLQKIKKLLYTYSDCFAESV